MIWAKISNLLLKNSNLPFFTLMLMFLSWSLKCPFLFQSPNPIIYFCYLITIKSILRIPFFLWRLNFFWRCPNTGGDASREKNEPDCPRKCASPKTQQKQTPKYHLHSLQIMQHMLILCKQHGNIIQHLSKGRKRMHVG